MVSAWELACKTGDLAECVKVSAGLDIAEKNEGLKKSSRYGYKNIVSHFLDVGADPDDEYAYALRHACGNGHSEIVATLLKRHTPSIKSTHTDASPVSASALDAVALMNVAFRMAVMFGRHKVVKSLLAVDGIDPTAQHNSPLVDAAQRGHAEVLQLLLNDERVRADERGAEAFELAASRGFDTAVDCLARAGCAADGDVVVRSFALACTNLHPTTAELLLKLSDARACDKGDSVISVSVVQRALLFVVARMDVGDIQDMNENLASIRDELRRVSSTTSLNGQLTRSESQPAGEHETVDTTAATHSETTATDDDYAPTPTRTQRRDALVHVLADYLYTHTCAEACGEKKPEEPQKVACESDSDSVCDGDMVAAEVPMVKILSAVVLYACRSGKVAHVMEVCQSMDEHELNKSEVWAECGEECLISSAQNGFTKIVKFLLSVGEIEPGCANNEALILACANGHEDTVALLLSETTKGVDPSAQKNRAMRGACANGYIEIVQMLLKTRRVSTSNNDSECFRLACTNGHVEVAQILLRYSLTSVDVVARENQAIRLASLHGHKDIVALLLSNTECNPSANDNEALLVACAKGHHVIVDALLRNSSVDPSVNYNEAIVKAAENGHIEVVVRLLVDRRVDCSTDNDSPLRLACANGYLRVVEVLMGRPKVDPSAYNNGALKLAAENGHADIVDVLLGDERVHANTDNQYAFNEACRNGHVAVVELLLDEEDIDPALNNSIALSLAAKRGKKAVCDLLLEDGRVDVSVLKDVQANRKASRRELARALREYEPEVIEWSGPVYRPATKASPQANAKDSATDFDSEHVPVTMTTDESVEDTQMETPHTDIDTVALAAEETSVAESTNSTLSTDVTPSTSSDGDGFTAPKDSLRSTSPAVPKREAPDSLTHSETVTTLEHQHLHQASRPSLANIPSPSGLEVVATICVLSAIGLAKKTGALGQFTSGTRKGVRSKASNEKDGLIKWDSPISISVKFVNGQAPPPCELRLFYEAKITKSEKLLGVVKVQLPAMTHYSGEVSDVTLAVCDKRGVPIPRATVTIQAFYKHPTHAQLLLDGRATIKESPRASQSTLTR